MDLLFLAFIAIGLLLLLVLVIYLVDRVNSLEKDTKTAIENLSATAQHPVTVASDHLRG
jgi:uncharacterized membrane protein YqjE